MAIRPQPEMVDLQGFRRRGWEFDFEGQTYFIQITGDHVAVMRKGEGGWLPLPDDEADRVYTKFEEELAKGA